MRPSAQQLIDGIAWSLDNRVEPQVEDKWAASTLRSVRCLLTHLSVRVETEGQILFDDNADLRATLREVCDLLPSKGDLPTLAAESTDVLEMSWREDGDYPTVESMTEENEALRALVDRLLEALYRTGQGPGSDWRGEAIALLGDYIRRQIVREQPMFLPAFLSGVF